MAASQKDQAIPPRPCQYHLRQLSLLSKPNVLPWLQQEWEKIRDQEDSWSNWLLQDSKRPNASRRWQRDSFGRQEILMAE